jgi:hypothetical protein
MKQTLALTGFTSELVLRGHANPIFVDDIERYRWTVELSLDESIIGTFYIGWQHYHEKQLGKSFFTAITGSFAAACRIVESKEMKGAHKMVDYIASFLVPAINDSFPAIFNISDEPFPELSARQLAEHSLLPK